MSEHTKIFEHNKTHIIAILIIVLAVLVVMHNYLSLAYTGGWDLLKLGIPTQYLPLKEAVFKYHTLPLWNPRIWGGEPYVGISSKPTFYLFYYPALLIPTAAGAMNYLTIFHLILAGIGAYLLAYEIMRKSRPAVLSAIVFMFSGHVMAKISNGVVVYLQGLAWIPFAFIAVKRAVEGKSWVNYSILAGVLMSIQFNSGSYDYFLFTSVLVAIYVAYHLIQTKGKEIVKIIKIFALIGVLLLGLSLVNIIPTLNFLKYTNRNTPYELKYAFDPDAPTNTLTLGNILQKLVWLDMPGRENQANIGTIAALLVLISLVEYKKEWAKFFWIIVIFTILYSMGTPIYDLFFYLFPLVNKVRYASRVLVLFSLASAMLAGFGSIILYDKLKKRYRWSDKKQNIFYGVIAILLIIDMAYVNYQLPLMVNQPEKVSSATILTYMAEVKSNSQEPFRTHAYETVGIDSSTQEYAGPLGLDLMYGFEGALWIPEYMNQYLSIAWYDPPKFWGILNVKYITAQKELNYTEFRLVKKFDLCANCTDMAYGPYLYENLLSRSRALNPGNSVLVVGADANALDAMYRILLSQNLSTLSATVVKGDNAEIIKYDNEFLRRFNIIILTPGSLGGLDISTSLPPVLKNLLTDYENAGGVVMPDILHGQSSVDEREIAQALASLNKRSNDIKITSYTPNSVVVDVEGKTGLLVMSEKYFMFRDDWTAQTNDGKKLTLYRADGMATAVEIPENTKTIRFTYMPKYFELLALIAILTAAGIIIYAVKYCRQQKPEHGKQRPNLKSNKKKSKP